MEVGQQTGKNKITKHKAFWILWILEFLFMVWWLLDELQLDFISPSPFVYVGFLILGLALILKKGLEQDNLALILVSIPGLLLGVMVLIVCIVLIISTFFGPIRWN